MKKKNRCKIFSLRSIILYVFLLFSVMFPLSVYAEKKEIVISFKDANANSCEIADMVIHPGETITLPEAPADRDTANTVYGAPSWKPVLEGCGLYLKSSDILTYEQVSALSETYGTENVLTLYGTRALSLAYYNNDGSKKLWQLYYYEGAAATLKDTPYAPNKAYKGWTTEKNGTSVALQFKQKVQLQEDLNVYLVTYARVRYFNKTGSILYYTEYYKPGTDALICIVPELSKYRSLGWSTSKNGSKVNAAAGTKVTVSGDLDLYAVYKYLPYTIKFTDNNGKSTAKAFTDLTQWAASGEYITLPEVPEAANYIALGWSYKANDTTARVKAGAKVKISKNTIYYAVYRNARTLTITFVDQDGSTSGSFNNLKKTVKEGTVFTLPALPNKNGYDPVSWKLNINGFIREYVPGTKIKAGGNCRFFASYRKAIQVILHYNDGKTYQAVTVKKGAQYSLPAMVNPEGYTFMGWGNQKSLLLSPTKPLDSYYPAGTKLTVNATRNLYAVLMKQSAEGRPSAAQLSGKSSPDTSAYKQIFFLGDSRTDRMKQTLIKQGINYSAKNVSFIALGGKGLWWLKSEAYPQLLKELDQTGSSDERPTAVIFNFGINDLSNRDSYISFYNSIAPTLKEKNCRLFFMSVNPVNSAQRENCGFSVRLESDVAAFNAAMKSSLAGNYTYMDTHSWLMKTGLSYDVGQYGSDVGWGDGLHYTVNTYMRIYLRALQFLAGK